MSEELRILPARTFTRHTSARDVAAVFFRRPRLCLISFLLVLIAGVLYALLAPSYRAEMKVLVRRGRIDPAVTPTETASPLMAREEITEEDLNSEVELLQDQDILRKVVLDTGLANRSRFPRLSREDPEEQMAHAVKRLAGKLNVQPVRKSHLITVLYKSSDPRLSAAVLKALADEYLAKHVSLQRPSGQQTFFEEQMQQARRALDDAETQLLQFTRKRKVVSATLERDLTLQKLSEAESADLGLQASIAEAGERVRTLEAKM